MLPGKQLKDETCAGGGVEEFNTYVDSSGHDFEILGIATSKMNTLSIQWTK